MSRHLGVIILLAIVTASRAPGQWTIGAEVGIAHFTGSSIDTTTTTDPAKLSPDRPTTVGLRIARDAGRVRFGVRWLYAKAGLAARKGAAALLDKNDMQVFEIALEASYRLARVGSAGALRLEAGPILDLWAVRDLDARTRAGGQAAIVWEWEVSGRLRGAIRATAGVTGSVFQADELPAELARRATWRRGVTIGLAYRL